MTLTRAQKKRYLRRAGNVCPNPHCNSEDLRTLGKPTTNDKYDGYKTQTDKCIARDIQCMGCGETWTDIYVLSDIVE